MEERKFSFRSTTDETPVVFTDEETKAFKKAWNDLHFGMNTLMDEVKDNRLNVGYKGVLANCIENYTLDLLKVLGYEGQLEKEKTERYSEIRGFNEQNRELRRQLGEKVSMEDMREAVKNLTKKVTKWWNVHGLGHISGNSEAFKGYAFECTLSTMFTDAYYAKSDGQKEEDYETIEQKVERFISLGFDIDKTEGRRDAQILGTENNITLLTNMIKGRFPSAMILKLDISFYVKHPKGQIRDISIAIKNYEEI